jgi:hypothetical protein
MVNSAFIFIKIYVKTVKSMWNMFESIYNNEKKPTPHICGEAYCTIAVI